MPAPDDLLRLLLTLGPAFGAAAIGLLVGYLAGRRRGTGPRGTSVPSLGISAEIAITVLREFLRNATGPIAVKDLEGRFVLVNDRFAAIHGTTPEQLAGTRIAALYPPDKMRFFEEQDRLMLAGGATTQNEVRAVHRDGRVTELLTTRFPVRDDRGKVLAIGTINTDIGALKAVEAELRAHRDNLETVVTERTDELRSLNTQKDRLFSIVAHDLRGPFNTILGFSAILAEKSGQLDPAKAALFARNIHDSSKTLFNLLNNLLDWSRLQMDAVSFEAEPQEVAGLADEAISHCRLIADTKGIAIAVDIADDLAVVADRTALITVLRNLIGNAVKFSRTGSKIVIRGRRRGGHVEIELADSGIGMDDHTRLSLFDLSRKTVRAGTNGEGGTGLGLYICQELVARQNGTIHVDSAAGQGTTVRLTLPAAGPDDSAALPATPAEAARLAMPTLQ